MVFHCKALFSLGFTPVGPVDGVNVPEPLDGLSLQMMNGHLDCFLACLVVAPTLIKKGLLQYS